MYFTVHVFCEIAIGGGHCLKKKNKKTSADQKLIFFAES